MSKGYYNTDVKSYKDYYPFGSLMPGRYSGGNEYRYGMNGMEKDDEVTGVEGSSYTATFWQYDSRLGRRWNVDPIVKSWRSPYDAFSNNPIIMVDPKGDDDYYTTSGQYIGSDFNKSSQKIRIISNRSIFYELRKNFKLAMANGTDLETAKLELQNSLSKKSTLLTNYQIFSSADYSMLTSIGEHLFKKYVSKEDVKLSVKDRSSVMSTTGQIENGSREIIFSISPDWSDKADYISGSLENKYDIVNTYVHEYYHYINTQNRITDPNWYGATSEESQEYAITHLESYREQLNHWSWKYTSKKFKDHIKTNIDNYMKYVTDKGEKKTLKAEFDELQK